MERKLGGWGGGVKSTRTGTFLYCKLSCLSHDAHEVAFSVTFVEVLWHLAGVAAAVGAALFHGRTLSVLLAALHAGCCEAAGLLRRRTVALLHSLYGLEELAAGETLVVLLGKERLRRCGRRRGGEGGGGGEGKNTSQITL